MKNTGRTKKKKVKQTFIGDFKAISIEFILKQKHLHTF